MVDVSIIICTRDRAGALSGTLASLKSIRSRHTWEVILLDNGSVDNTAAVIRAAARDDGHLRYAYEGQPGLGAARDAAWRIALGSICSFSDDDCYLDGGFVDGVIAAYREHHDAGCIGGRIMLFDPLDAPITIDERHTCERLEPHGYFPCGRLQGANMSFPRHVLEKIGGFDRDLGAGTLFPCEDADVIARSLWAGYPAYFDPRPVVHHHHGRRGAAVAAAAAGYDDGRGAYHAKFVLRSDTRRTYISKWLMQGRWNANLTQNSLDRELASARTYLRKKGAGCLAVVLGPFFRAMRLVQIYWDWKLRRNRA